MRKFVPALLISVLLVTPLRAGAEPYQNYIYDSRLSPRAEPQAYIFDRTITGADMGIGSLKEPGDVFVADDNGVYIADTGNNRIVHLDENYKLLRVFSQFENHGKTDTFNAPAGIFVTPQGDLLVADTGNARVVRLSGGLDLVRIYEKPESRLITDEFKYEPVRVAVDAAGRIFIVSKNVNMGIIMLDAQGEFVSFLGAVKTTPDLSQVLWKLIATKEQKERMALTLPTEYSSIDIDRSNFVYGTVSAIDPDKAVPGMFITRLNPTGVDVLKRNGFYPPTGDAEIRTDPTTFKAQYSQLNDVAAREYGIYSVMDNRMGRIFTYSENGDLLYTFGGLGPNRGQFGRPEAIDVQHDETYLVADSVYGWIAVFKPTEYGTLITRAVQLYNQREYDKAGALWAKAFEYTANSDLIINHVARNMAKEGKNEEAMRYFSYTNDRTRFSDAFVNFRAEIAGRYIDWIIGGVMLLIVFAAVRPFFGKRRKRRQEKDDSHA